MPVSFGGGHFQQALNKLSYLEKIKIMSKERNQFRGVKK